MTPEPILITLGCAIGSILIATLLCAFYWEGLGLMLVGPRPRDNSCPRCGRGVIERISASSAGDRFYLCNCCGERYKRSSRGGPYHDASGAEFDGAFLRRTREGACEKHLPPIDEETRWTRTIDTLVWCKRSRDLCEVKTHTSGGPRDPGYSAPLWDRELDQ
jgi:hypothetical protein